jgi:hypothetical protein
MLPSNKLLSALRYKATVAKGSALFLSSKTVPETENFAFCPKETKEQNTKINKMIKWRWNLNTRLDICIIAFRLCNYNKNRAKIINIFLKSK